MATSKAVKALEQTKEALEGIQETLQPVIQRLKDDDFGESTGQARATVALSIGMMKYMGARLQGLDQGRKPDDPLRKELNQMRKVLAELKAKGAKGKEAQQKSNESPSKTTKPSKSESPRSGEKRPNPSNSEEPSTQSSKASKKRRNGTPKRK